MSLVPLPQYTTTTPSETCISFSFCRRSDIRNFQYCLFTIKCLIYLGPISNFSNFKDVFNKNLSFRELLYLQIKKANERINGVSVRDDGNSLGKYKEFQWEMLTTFRSTVAVVANHKD